MNKYPVSVIICVLNEEKRIKEKPGKEKCKGNKKNNK